MSIDNCTYRNKLSARYALTGTNSLHPTHSDVIITPEEGFPGTMLQQHALAGSTAQLPVFRQQLCAHVFLALARVFLSC